jgi:hypothetical protein
VGGAHGRDRLDAVELVREGLDAGSAQRLELAPAVGQDVGVAVPRAGIGPVGIGPVGIGPLTHGPSPRGG